MQDDSNISSYNLKLIERDTCIINILINEIAEMNIIKEAMGQFLVKIDVSKAVKSKNDMHFQKFL